MAPWKRVPLLLTCVVFACLLLNLPSRQSGVVREDVGVARSAPRLHEIAPSPSGEDVTGVAPPPSGIGGVRSHPEGGSKQVKKEEEEEKQKGKRRKAEEQPLKVLNGLLGLPLFKDYVKNLKEGLDELFYTIKPASLGVPEVEDKTISKVNKSRFTEEIVADAVTHADLETGHSGPHRRTYTLPGCGCVREAAEEVVPGHVILRRSDQSALCQVVRTVYYGKRSDRSCMQYFSSIPSGQGLIDILRELSVGSMVGTLWRFVAFADPLVDAVLSRDLDSYILPRGGP
nr:uncharacterized protein LOC113828562 [Penaeus vannamei]